MMPSTWKSMVQAANEVVAAMGDGVKRVEGNELESRIVQRRAIRIKDGNQALSPDNLEFLRPCPDDALTPADFHRVLHRKLKRPLESGSAITYGDLE